MDRWGPRLSRTVNASGLILAALGFLLTRFTVTFAMYDDPFRFFLVGLVPLLMGLSVAAFGVVLAVGAFGRSFVRTVTAWSVVGVGMMALLVLLTLYGTEPGSLTDLASIRSKTYLSNFLIGGSFGGTLTGIYAARNRRERLEQRAQAKRMVVLNRVLRDQVLNSITAIRGHLDVFRGGYGDEDVDRAIDVIAGQSETLEETVQEITHLTKSSRSPNAGLERVDVGASLRECVATARRRYPDAEIVLDDPPAEAAVWADEMVEHVVELLIENAVEHNPADAPRVEIGVERLRQVLRLSVEDNGPGLPADQQAILDDGSVADFDDPLSGFGLNVVSLLVESYRGTVRSIVGETGTRIEVDLAVADSHSGMPMADPSEAGTFGASRGRLAVAILAALGAGVAMGVLIDAMANVVPVIGALYDAANPVVGWVTHEFHSVVFGLMYVSLLSMAPARFQATHAGRVVVAVAWGLALWLFAAGVVMPLWLQLVGVPNPPGVPNLTVPSFLGHLVWGLGLGGLYSLGETALDRRLLVDDLAARLL